MYGKKWWNGWGFFFLVVLLSGCETPGTGSSKGSASVATLTPSQSERYQQALSKLEHAKPQEAEELLEDLVREKKDVAELWVNLALSQYQQSKWQMAEKTVQQTLSAFPRVAQAYNLAGLLAVEKGGFKEAEQHYLLALKIRPSYSNALYNMALLQDVYLRNIPMAVEYYNRYLAVVKDDEATKAWAENLTQSLAR